jgi:DNA polymerase III subunit alpha
LKNSYVSLHTHTEYSLLDGASQISGLVGRAKKLGMPAIAMTDHGVMYGAIELIKECSKQGIKPIVGVEAYIINGDVEAKDKNTKRYHQILLAKNYQGYKNLVKLVTLSNLKGYYYKPRINKELLEQYSEGLIACSACLGGEIQQAILQGNEAKSIEVALWYKEVFGDDFYLELQDHGSREDRIVNPALVKIGEQLGIKQIISNDSHFTCADDVDMHDALLCISTGKQLEEENRLRYSGSEFLKSRKEMLELFADHLPLDVIKQAADNTLEIGEKVEEYSHELFGIPRMPVFPVPEGYTPESYFYEVSRKCLQDRITPLNLSPEKTLIYQNRLEYELKIMADSDFAGYFLVVWDYIRFARESDIPVGPGRGSAAGSLVAYSLGITNIDPIRFNLLFERFLNPERKSMPDVDTDFCIERRSEVIDYVSRLYGENHVANISTFNRLAPRAALKDVARVKGVPYLESERLAKLVPVVRGVPASLSTLILNSTPSKEFKDAYESEEWRKEWIDLAIKIEGTNKSHGVHAAGVVISGVELDSIVPLYRNKEGQVTTQYPMADIEALGLLKMDFLGLRNLTMIKDTLNLVKEATGESIDLESLSFEDKKTFDLIQDCNLGGVFQLESSGMRGIVKELQPSSLGDISAILALYRPGPLDTGMIPDFIEQKKDSRRIYYFDPLLEPILKDTYGTILYQEQIMQASQDLAGYSLGEADLLRRAMGKKKPEEMEKQREKFVNGAISNGVVEKVATDLFEQMVAFASYCLAYETQVWTVEYGYLPIGEIVEEKIAATVLSLNEKGETYHQMISQWHDQGIKDVFEYELDNGITIRATPDHKIMTASGEMVSIEEIFEKNLDIYIGER